MCSITCDFKNLQLFASIFPEILQRFRGVTMEQNMLLNLLVCLQQLRKHQHT